MGFAMAYSACIGCRQVFAYNPLRVPSVRINGQLEPICPSCVARTNPRRVANGLPPIEPLPDAYEPLDESELP
jgi:hypothetical protein